MKFTVLVISWLAPAALACGIADSLIDAIGHCDFPARNWSSLFSTLTCSVNKNLTGHEAPGSAYAAVNPAWTYASSCTANGTDEYCVFVSSTFGGGRGIGMLTSPERAEYVANLPVFTDTNVLAHENKDPDPALSPLDLVHIPGKDMGVVAKKPIYRGDHLMSFTPAVVIDYSAYENLPYQDVMKLQMEAVDHLPNDLKGRFLNLSTHDGAASHDERVDKILKTNAFDIELRDENNYNLFVVFPELSRFNHDCRPNAEYWFDPSTLVQHVYATRPIAIGEEISVTYIDPLRPRARRQKKLHGTWGFKCSCSLCSQRPELTNASDDRIKQLLDIRTQLEDHTTTSAATPQMAELFVSLHQQERLDGLIHEAYMFAALEWNGVGEPWDAMRYARLAIESGLAAVGSKDQDVVEMQRLAEDPWGHWSWMLRTQKRMHWERMRSIGSSSRSSMSSRYHEDDEEEEEE